MTAIDTNSFAQKQQLRETREYANYIDGQWVKSKSGKAFENRNPANQDDLVGLFQDSTADDVNAAVDAAQKAYESWRLVPAPKRAEYLYRVGDILKRRKDEMAREMTREMGKIVDETKGDIQEAIDMAFLAAGEGRRLFGVTTPSELANKFNMAVRMPLGVAGLITPWNFPMAIPAWKGMAALICGNTVVIKPASLTPLSVIMLTEALEEAELPRGVWNVVTGGGREVGEPMLKHPKVRVISFTGSTEVGRDINVACAPQFKHVHLEMGGKNVIMVMEDADVDLAVDGALWGAFGTTGQRCTAASRIVVHDKVYDQFVEKLAGRAKSLKVGNGLDSSVQMGPSVSESQRKTVEQYVQIGKDEGAKCVAGGNALRDGDYAKGFFHEPTVFAEVTPEMRIAQEEIFGPVTAVIRCNSLENAIEIGNGVRYGLSSSIYTRDVNKAFVAMRDMYTGIFYVNAPTIGAEVHLPFGGVKETGNGHREAGVAGIDVFSEWKSIYVDYSGALQRAQIDTEI
ncbi:MAG TPA: aldehyde dehydrogenase family protein [Thermoanaerobaculia bacterium]|jgi:aldehyde dehydrogenase (NAD+)|nr:aldehyde dehydrogenase family protein [Thermoanaerobaculia bacterium]